MMCCQIPLITYAPKWVQGHCQRYKNLQGHTLRTIRWRFGSYDEPRGLDSFDESNWIKSNPNWANLSSTQVDSCVK